MIWVVSKKLSLFKSDNVSAMPMEWEQLVVGFWESSLIKHGMPHMVKNLRREGYNNGKKM